MSLCHFFHHTLQLLSLAQARMTRRMQHAATSRVNQCIVVDCVWQWQEVLDILADALNDNNIKYRMLHASRKFEVTAFCYHET